MSGIPIPELEWQDDNGTIYPLEWPGRHVLEVSGLGMPPVAHWTTRSPYQHGRTHWGYAFQQRVINMVLYVKGNDRACMWQGRAANCAMLSPLIGPGLLRLTYGFDTFEVHDVWFNSGYDLSSQQQTHLTQTGGLQLVCNDPFWKWVTAPLDASETRDDEGRICVETSTFTFSDELELPFTGPFLLGTTIATVTLTCTNDGSWRALPVISLEGPMEDWYLDNTATGQQIAWNGYTIAAGEIVTLDIKNKTITNQAGTDLSKYASGHKATFYLEPGANDLDFWASGVTAITPPEIAVCWYVEMLGT